MKNLFKLFVPAAVAALALVSCNKEQNYEAPEAVTIRVHATANDLMGDDQETKTYIDANKTIIWGTGEYMKLALTAGENTTFANSTDASADTFNGQPSATFEFSVSPATAASYTYQGLYPASAAATSSNTNAANYKVNLPAIQNATASSYDPAAYIMVAKPETFTSVQTDWVASFRRGTALNKITLKNFDSSVSINKVKITATGKKLAGGRHFNLTTGEGLEVYGTEATIDVLYATPLSGTSMDVWFTSWDTEIAEGEKLTIVAYTTDSKSYTKEITVPSGRSIKFREGYLNTTGVSMSGISPAEVTEIDEGSYLVLAKDGSNYYALKAEKEAGKERLVSVAYDGSLASYLGEADLVWNLSKSGNSYIFENSSKYLGYKGSSNESYWLEADENWTTDNYLLDITAQGSASDPYHVTLHSNASKYLSKNSSGDFFAFYGNTTQKADIVFVPATVDTRTPVTLSFAEDAISKTTANYSEFTGQTATATPSVSGITYAIDGDNIGTITAATGAVALNGNTGSATVTATFAGDATYRPATASYTINVSNASGPQYNLVSAVADVVEGDYIITWDNTYYLPSGSTSGTNPAVGTGITVAGDKITNTVTSDMVWTFTGDNTNGFTISDGTNILHSTNAAQGISITTTSTRKWTVSVDGTYGMLLHGNDGGSRYLAVYNSGSWRYYSTGNSYTGVLRLYKLASGPAVTWNLESIAITTEPTKTVYTEGQSFDPAGMVVTGHFVDADDNTNTKDEEVTGYTISPDGALSTSDDHVTITYQGKTTTQAITVNAAGSETPSLQYTLTPATGSDNGYATSEDIEVNGITWNVTGNTTMIPWRIGGKSLSSVDRALYSKTALNKSITSINITHGAASNITVNSMTVIVSKNADFSSPVSTLTPSFVAEDTVTVDRPDGKDWSNCYYKIVYNVSVTGTTNRFIQFTEAKFYGTN